MTTVLARGATAASNPIAAVTPFVGRALISAIFLLSGFSKVADPAGTIGYIEAMGLPFAEVALAGAIAVELIGGILLIAGYRTKLVAAILAAFSLVTAFGFHFDLADQNQFVHFFKNIAMAGGLLQVVAFGAGGASLDSRR